VHMALERVDILVSSHMNLTALPYLQTSSHMLQQQQQSMAKRLRARVTTPVMGPLKQAII
jgi:hypothetical protein